MAQDYLVLLSFHISLFCQPLLRLARADFLWESISKRSRGTPCRLFSITPVHCACSVMHTEQFQSNFCHPWTVCVGQCVGPYTALPARNRQRRCNAVAFQFQLSNCRAWYHGARSLSNACTRYVKSSGQLALALCVMKICDGSSWRGPPGSVPASPWPWLNSHRQVQSNEPSECLSHLQASCTTWPRAELVDA